METTPVFLPGESHGQRSLVGCSLWGHKESDMTEQPALSLQRQQKHMKSYRKKKIIREVNSLSDFSSVKFSSFYYFYPPSLR